MHVASGTVIIARALGLLEHACGRAHQAAAGGVGVHGDKGGARGARGGVYSTAGPYASAAAAPRMMPYSFPFLFLLSACQLPRQWGGRSVAHTLNLT